mmetsp:Transcript_46148/g.103980  ORF Transcript_46148/g.103980 Transcript_46148/m.103980 type:complete len:311 (-) Transcript_46148:64-996(-)
MCPQCRPVLPLDELLHLSQVWLLVRIVALLPQPIVKIHTVVEIPQPEHVVELAADVQPRGSDTLHRLLKHFTAVLVTLFHLMGVRGEVARDERETGEPNVHLDHQPTLIAEHTSDTCGGRVRLHPEDAGAPPVHEPYLCEYGQPHLPKHDVLDRAVHATQPCLEDFFPQRVLLGLGLLPIRFPILSRGLGIHILDLLIVINVCLDLGDSNQLCGGVFLTLFLFLLECVLLCTHHHDVIVATALGQPVGDLICFWHRVANVPRVDEHLDLVVLELLHMLFMAQKAFRMRSGATRVKRGRSRMPRGRHVTMR